ncbi:helix-turn-helix domain-containing protein [Nonomuraea sp. NPDC048881]
MPVALQSRSSQTRSTFSSETVQQIADEFGVTRPTIYRHLTKDT